MRTPLVACVDGIDPSDGYGAVYALVDPRNNAVRYVGQTVTLLTNRLAGHLASKNPGIRAWTRELRQLGLRPTIRVIRHVPLADLGTAEAQAIANHAWDGWDLLNLIGIPQECARDPQVAAARARRTRKDVTAARDWAEAERRRIVEEELDDGARRSANAALLAVALSVSGGPLPPRALGIDGDDGLATWFGLAVMPWRMAVMSARLPISGHEFARLVSEDEEVRVALAASESRDWHRSVYDERDCLSASEVFAIVVPYAEGELYAIAEHAAIRGGLPEAMATLARVGGLPSRCVDMFAQIEPNAVERTFGSDILADADRRLVAMGYPKGTAREAAEALCQAIANPREAPRESWRAHDFLEDLLRRPRVIPRPTYPFADRASNCPVGRAVDQAQVLFRTLVAHSVTALSPDVEVPTVSSLRPFLRCA
jgi:hypothetical protein